MINLEFESTIKYALLIEYDGNGLVGWQKQDIGVSVQGSLEKVAKQIFNDENVMIMFVIGQVLCNLPHLVKKPKIVQPLQFYDCDMQKPKFNQIAPELTTGRIHGYLDPQTATAVSNQQISSAPQQYILDDWNI